MAISNLSIPSSDGASRNPRVGLLDLDIFGPSVPKLMGLENAGEPLLSECMFILLRGLTGTDGGEANKLIPMNNHGIKTMSIGYLLRESVITPLLHNADPEQLQARTTITRSSGAD